MKKIIINKSILILLLIILITLLVIYYSKVIDNFENQKSSFRDQITRRGFGNIQLEINKNHYNGNGFNLYGYDRDGYDRDGYDKDGFDKNGYDRDGYNRKGLHKDGYDINGYNKLGYNKYGFDATGYNYINRDSQYYDKNGFDRKGYDRNGYDKDGYNIKGFNKSGYNRDGYDEEGYNIYGYNKEGVNKFGYDIDGNKVSEDKEENILNKYFKKSKKTFFNMFPFNIKNDILDQKIKKETNDYVNAYNKIELYFRSNDAIGNNTLYQKEQNKKDISRGNFKDVKNYKCWLGNQEDILNRNGQYASYKKFDCSLNEFYQKCKMLEKEDKCLLYVPSSCIKKYDDKKKGYVDDCESNSSFEEVDKKNGTTIKQVVSIDKDGNKQTQDIKLECPDDFKCINLPEDGGFGCPNKDFSEGPLEPINYTPEELKKFKDDGEGFPVCEYPQVTKSYTNCYIGDNKNILNENSIFSPYIKYGCDLYNNYKKCMDMSGGKYLVHDNNLGNVIEKELKKNSDGKYILPDGTIYNQEEYCKTPPDNVGISGFGCYNEDGTEFIEPLDPQKNKGNVCKYPIFDITDNNSNNINIYNKETEMLIGRINDSNNKQNIQKLKDEIKNIDDKKQKLLSRKKILIDNNKKLYNNIKKKYQTYLKNIKSNSPDYVKMKNYIKDILDDIDDKINKLN